MTCAFSYRDCIQNGPYLHNQDTGESLCEAHRTQPHVRYLHWRYPDIAYVTKAGISVPIAEAFQHAHIATCWGCSRPLHSALGIIIRKMGEFVEPNSHPGCDPYSQGEGEPPPHTEHFGHHLPALFRNFPLPKPVTTNRYTLAAKPKTPRRHLRKRP